ncbi:MAG TPA: helix-turn-helix transcriptional regulator [Candidatus Sulfotelmatobacter sp.]|jgi:DNA-binding NarL/FixJ family response regulator|nr:helix-turn-helix transcriptional regulator [Candidatus Sulfotelmatobacter sp.]
MEPRFSPRQAEIVALIASGYSDKQIALALRVSQRTVRTQLERLYATNGLHCRAQAVLIWAQSARMGPHVGGNTVLPASMGAS